MLGIDSLLLRKIFVAVVGIVSAATPMVGQDCRVTTNVRVLVEHHDPSLNITADQLKAEIGGKPAQVLSFARGSKPQVILLIDISGSMKNRWKQLIAASKQLAAGAGENVSALVFRENILAYAGGAADTEKLLNQLSGVKPEGGTALYDVLMDAAGRARNPDTVLIVISDGEDNASRHSSDQTIDQFIKSGWPPVFGLVLDYDEQSKRRRQFKNIVDATGGLAVYPPSADNVPEAANNLAAEIYAPYRVTLQASKPIVKRTPLELSVIDAGGKTRHDIHIIQPAGVAACNPAGNSSGNQQ